MFISFFWWSSKFLQSLLTNQKHEFDGFQQSVELYVKDTLKAYFW